MHLRSPDAIKTYLARRYPGCNIESIHLNIRIDSLSSLENNISQLKDILSEAEKSGDERLFPKCRFCACLRTDSTPPPLAIEYYGEQKEIAESEIRREAHYIFNKDHKLDSAFVCMQQLEDARQIGI